MHIYFNYRQIRRLKQTFRTTRTEFSNKRIAINSFCYVYRAERKNTTKPSLGLFIFIYSDSDNNKSLIVTNFFKSKLDFVHSIPTKNETN